MTMINTDQFVQHISGRGLCAPADRILLAVSGGADSMAMWHLFKEAGYKVGVAHVNFHLRGEASDHDQQFVQNAALKYNVPFHTTSFDTISYAQRHKLSVEDAARKLRYTWLEEIRSAEKYSVIATAHHMHDNAETMLMNLTRGTGLQGITGIPELNGHVIRPLLFAGRKDIESYCTLHEIAFCTDHTNMDTEIRRNYFRHRIIPALEEVNPAFISTMYNNARHFREGQLLAKEQIHRLLHKWIKQRGNDKLISLRTLQKHPAALTILHTWLFTYGFNEDQCRQILEPHGHESKQFSGNAHRVVITRDHVILTDIDPQIIATRIIAPNESTVHCGAYKLTFDRMKPSPSLRLLAEKDVAFFDADKLTWPLLLRSWQSGDYLYPLGLKKQHSDKPGKKKVSDLLTDAKLSRLDKERTGVLLSGEYLIWVPGVRQDGRFAVTKSTQNIIKIKMLPG